MQGHSLRKHWVFKDCSRLLPCSSRDDGDVDGFMLEAGWGFLRGESWDFGWVEMGVEMGAKMEKI